eukprot:scaffold109285_cov63-Cyclotella_meneghiniana.AAC.1
MFKKKQMKVVARKDGSKVVHYNRLRKYLFNPTRETDKETTDTVIELASTAVDAVITELEDKRKATFKYLDISGSEYCFANCTEDRKAALMGVTATNDEAESALGSVTGNIQRYGRINLFAAAAVASAKRTKARIVVGNDKAMFHNNASCPIKRKELLRLIKEEGIFGNCVAHVAVIEFQKREIPPQGASGSKERERVA